MAKKKKVNPPKQYPGDLGSEKNVEALKSLYSSPASKHENNSSSKQKMNQIEEKYVMVLCKGCSRLIKSEEVEEHPEQCLRTATKGAEAHLVFTETLIGLDHYISLMIDHEDSKGAKIPAPVKPVPITHNRLLGGVRYHLQAAIKWQPNDSELGFMSNHTVKELDILVAKAAKLDDGAEELYHFISKVSQVAKEKERYLRFQLPKLLQKSRQEEEKKKEGSKKTEEDPNKLLCTERKKKEEEAAPAFSGSAEEKKAANDDDC